MAEHSDARVRDLLACALLLASALIVPSVLAENKSGVEPQVLSLPKGPGSIEGLGESFEPLLNTGTAAYRVPFAVPPGIGASTPSLALAYDGGYGNGPVGLGWRLDLPAIQRQTDKGLPSYTDADRLLHSSAGELVPIGSGRYRAKVEGSFLRVERSGLGFVVSAPDGSRQWFGTTADARLETPRGTFQWRLERTEDANGNAAIYQYQTDSGQLYLSAIHYSPAADGSDKAILFRYAVRPDPVTDYRSRSRVSTAWRLTDIEMQSQGNPVRAYRLDYGDATSTPSLLRQVTQLGADGSSSLPPMTFGYSAFDRTLVTVSPMANPPPRAVSLSNANVDLVDIDGDGLPDLIHTPTGGNPHQLWLNLGGFAWAAPPVVPAASPRRTLDTNGVLMADMDGDGRSDLFVKGTSVFGWFRNRGALTWEETDWVDAGLSPRFGFEDARTRLLDLDNDKLIDVLRDYGDRYYYWLNPGAGPWSTDFDGEGSGAYLPLDRVNVRLGDLNGDRIDDLVYLLDGYCTYFPGMGLGDFDAAEDLANPPFGIEPDRLTLTDFDHDGLADWVEVGNRYLRVWRNAGNGGFEPEWLIENTPATAGTWGFRFADMDGDGMLDLLFTSEDAGGPYQVIRFNAGTHPHLLTRIANGLGRETRISYRSSIVDYLADRDAGEPWTRKLPFPVHVVAQVRVRDNNSGAEYVTDYRYRDGYYDGAEKEFRGFGEVERHEHGGPGAPGLITRFRFDVGDTEESRKGLLLAESTLTENGTEDPPTGLFETAAHQLTTRTLATGTDGTPVRYSFTDQTETGLYEGTPNPLTLRRAFDRDAYGNLIRDTDYGLVDGADPSPGDDDLITVTDYAIDLERWLLDRPSRIAKTRLDGRFVSLQRLRYDANGNLELDERSPDGSRFIPVARNAYDGHGNLIRITDANGHWRTLDYDPVFSAFPIRETIGGVDLSMTASYDLGLGLMTGFTDPAGQSTGFGYDSFGRLIAIIKPGDSPELPTQRFEYRLGDPVSAIVTRQREVAGEPGTVDSLTWFDGLGRTLQTRAEGEHGDWIVTDAATFNARRGIARQWLPHFAASSDYADPDPALAHTDLAYDARGRIIRETNPDGSIRTTAYAPLTRIEHDEEDNRADGPHADTPRTSITDGRERLIEVREQNGAEVYVTRYAYDGQDHLTRIQDDQGNVRSVSFDGLGRKTAMDDPDKGAMTWTYDDAGNLITSTDAKGQTLSYSYDAANRTLTEDGAQVRVRYHYDDHRPADAPAITPLMTHTHGRLAWIDDQSGSDYFGYDPRGRVTTKVRRQDGLDFITRMQHDAADRLTRLGYPDGTTIDYRYNPMSRLEAILGYIDAIDYAANGQKTALQLANGVASQYEHDQRQRLRRLHTVAPDGTILQDLAYHYDSASNIERIADQRPIRTPEDRTGDYGYDDLYRLTSATAPAWSRVYSYNSIGNMTYKSDLGTMTYGAAGAGPHALTRTDDGTGTAGGVVDYRYDANGNLATKPGFSYHFDARDRLTRVERAATPERPAAVIDYAYDSGFDRRRKTVRIGDATETALYIDRHTELRGDRLIKQVFAGDRLIARISTAPFAASMLAGAAPVPTHADLDRAPADGVISVAEIAAAGADPSVIESSDLAAALAIYYDGRVGDSGRLPFATMAAAVDAVGGLPEPAVSETVFYLPDHLGSASVVVDGGGGVLEESVFYPYGQDRKRSGEYESEYRFAGKEVDKATHLHYFSARYCDCSASRFISVDPLVAVTNDPLLHRSNQYGYVRANPLRQIDPTGLAAEPTDHERGMGLSFSRSGALGVGAGQTFYRGPSGQWYVDNYAQAGVVAYAEAEYSVIQLAEEPTEGFYLAPTIGLEGKVGKGSAGFEIQFRFDNFYQDPNSASGLKAETTIDGKLLFGFLFVNAAAGSDGLSFGPGGGIGFKGPHLEGGHIQKIDGPPELPSGLDADSSQYDNGAACYPRCQPELTH